MKNVPSRLQHVPLQRLFAVLWPHYVPRKVMVDIKQLIDAYFGPDHRWSLKDLAAEGRVSDER